MAGERLRYWEAAPEGIGKLRELEHYLNTGTGLDATLLEFVRLRSSLMNGCEFCVKLHTSELRKHHETEERIAGVADWRNTDLYTSRERAALAWAESLTDIQEGHAPDPVYDELRRHFTEAETTNLTLTIATINAWNRIAISLGAHTHRGV